MIDTFIKTIPALAIASLLVCSTAGADEPMGLRYEWSGAVSYFATGAPMAEDGPDSDTTMVDLIAQPASVEVTSAEVPTDGAVEQAFLYWAGSIINDDCAGANIDDEVVFTPPGGSATTVTADTCYCSQAGASSYDIQACRADVTTHIGDLIGTYTVDEFDALIANGSTNNASFALVLVYKSPSLLPRRVGLYDGVWTMSSSIDPDMTMTLSGIDIDNPPEGNLTWYTVEGDVGGTGTEQVDVSGQPGGLSMTCTDPINPVGNPMNHTVNTTVPQQTDSIGVDIDQFDISSALTPADTSLDITYYAGLDKWWAVFNIVEVNVYEPLLGGQMSFKSIELVDDADSNSEYSHGDTARYTIHLENSGTAPGMVDVDDPIPAEAESWSLVDAAGGTDASTTTDLIVEDIMVPYDGYAEVIFDVVIGDHPDQTPMSNIADFDATPDGDSGSLSSPIVMIRKDTDGDEIFDNDDNCPDDYNPLQEDFDTDGIGDACDTPVDTDSDTDADTDTNTDIDTETETDSDTDTGMDAGLDGSVDADADSDSDTDSDTDADSDSDTDSDTDADSDSDTDSDADADSDSDTDSDTDADSDGGGSSSQSGCGCDMTGTRIGGIMELLVEVLP